MFKFDNYKGASPGRFRFLQIPKDPASQWQVFRPGDASNTKAVHCTGAVQSFGTCPDDLELSRARPRRPGIYLTRNNMIGINVNTTIPDWADLTEDQKTIITDAVLMPEFNDRAQIALDVYTAVGKALGSIANDVAV